MNVSRKKSRFFKFSETETSRIRRLQKELVETILEDGVKKGKITWEDNTRQRFVYEAMSPLIFDPNESLWSMMPWKRLAVSSHSCVVRFKVFWATLLVVNVILASLSLITYALGYGNLFVLFVFIVGMLFSPFLLLCSLKLLAQIFTRFDNWFVICNAVLLTVGLVVFSDYHVPHPLLCGILLLVVATLYADAAPVQVRKPLYIACLVFGSATTTILFLDLVFNGFNVVWRSKYSTQVLFFLDRSSTACFNIGWFYCTALIRRWMSPTVSQTTAAPLESSFLDGRVAYVLQEFEQFFGTDKVPTTSNGRVVPGEVLHESPKAKFAQTQRRLDLPEYLEGLRFVNVALPVSKPEHINSRQTIAKRLFGKEFARACFSLLKNQGAVLFFAWMVGVIFSMIAIFIEPPKTPAVTYIIACVASFTIPPTAFRVLNHSWALFKHHFFSPDSLFVALNNLGLTVCLYHLLERRLAVLGAGFYVIVGFWSGLDDCSHPKSRVKLGWFVRLVGSISYTSLLILFLKFPHVMVDSPLNLLGVSVSLMRVMYSILINLIIYNWYFLAVLWMNPHRFVCIQGLISVRTVPCETAVLLNGFNLELVSDLVQELLEDRGLPDSSHVSRATMIASNALSSRADELGS